MATPAFQRIKDIAVKTIELNSRLVLDDHANLSVAEVFADNKLTVDIGGNITFQACTIDFKYSTIDLTSASITTLGTLSFNGNLHVSNDVQIDGALLTYGPTYFGDDVQVAGTLDIGGNLNITSGNLYLDTLFVHEIFGHSPINFSSPANFGHLVQLLTADLSCRFGSTIELREQGSINVMERGDINVEGGNVMLTPVSGNTSSGGGQLMLMDGGDMHVVGGNVTISNHSTTGKGSLTIEDQGQVHMMGGNVNVMGNGNIQLVGGSIVFIDPNTMVQTGIITNSIEIFVAYKNSTQMINTGNYLTPPTTLTFDSVDSNNVGSFGTWNGTTTFTVNQDGWYELAGSIFVGYQFTPAQLSFTVNGAENYAPFGFMAPYDGVLGPLLVTIQTRTKGFITAGSNISLSVIQASGVTASVPQGRLEITRLSIM